MPIIRLPFERGQGNQLETRGPLIPVTISVPEALAKERGQHVQSPIRGTAMIDTGAYASAVDAQIFHKLGLHAIDRVGFQSAAGLSISEVFPVRLSFPELEIPRLELERVFGCPLGWREGSDEGLIMLIGRDILRKFLLIYDGIHDELILGH